jgi:HD-like signal output (HDOD) protein
MTPVAANPDLTAQDAPQADETQVSAVESEAALTESPHGLTPTPAARQFLDRLGLIEKMAPLRQLNQEIRSDHPQMDELYRVIEESPEFSKRFLKFANGAWFNSRIEVDSPVMAFSRFGTQGFYRLILATFLQESIGDLSTKFKIWPHLEWTARGGEMVARELAPKFADYTFAAGLLHDAIVPSMERELQDYLYFLECALNLDPVVTSLESNCHEFDHAQAAAELAHALSFEDCVVHAIAGHHYETMSSVPAGDARAVLGLLLVTKRALGIVRGQRKNPFESAAEKTLLREIADALGVSSGRIVNAIADVVDMLHLPAA